MAAPVTKSPANLHRLDPDALARAVVEHFLPCGPIIEPSAGDGAFLRALPKGADWYEIQKGRDFLKAEGRWDWAVGNPPFSQFRAFLQKAMQVADNVVFIGLAPAWFVRARQEDMRQARFALVELCALPIPPTWSEIANPSTLPAGRICRALPNWARTGARASDHAGYGVQVQRERKLPAPPRGQSGAPALPPASLAFELR